MRGAEKVLISIVITLLLAGCSKNKPQFMSQSSLVVTNAVVGGGNIKLNSNARDSVKTYNAFAFSVLPGNATINLFNTGNPGLFFKTTQLFTAGKIYSVFLIGQSPALEGIWVQDSIPSFYADSSIGIRLINLSPNSAPLNLTVASDTKVKLFYQIPYRELTGYIKLPLPTVIAAGSVTFQVRNGATDALLATYTLPTSVNSLYPDISVSNTRFKKLTLVVKGLEGTTTGADALGIFPVANY